MAQRNEVYIHPTAEVATDAQVGEGTYIWHQAQVRERARLGRNCIVGKGAYIDFEVTLGDNCKVQNGAYIYHPAQAGDGVFFGPGAIITNDRRPRAINPDGTLKKATDWRPQPVVIGQGAAIGAGAIVLPGVAIGRWAMVGAGGVVTRDVPDYTLVYGVPARPVGYVCPCGALLQPQSGDRYACSECDFEITIERNEL